MTQSYLLHQDIRLEGWQQQEARFERVSSDDARRQQTTARAILERLRDHPGVVLADEVGMGKTFVALAVATSVTLMDSRRRPVVVMVPATLTQKWERDFSFFRDRCLNPETANRVRCRSAVNGVEFLKLLDDPLDRRASIIFLTHGAMNRGLTDGWVKLALIQHALRYKRDAREIRRALSKCGGELLHMKWVQQRGGDIWDALLERHPDQWLDVLKKRGIDPEGDRNPETDDDPVPAAVLTALGNCTTQVVYEALQKIPERKSTTWKQRVADARSALGIQLKAVWKQCVEQLDFKLPLLVMDEAHHLKNENNLAKLFRSAESEGDAVEVSRGALGGVFERMLFLTATPFQLGHPELCSVLSRFDGIDWNSSRAPTSGCTAFREQRQELGKLLDAAQGAALNLEAVWGRLRHDDLVIDGKPASTVDAWWEHMRRNGHSSKSELLKIVDITHERMRAAEKALKPFVIRHLRRREFNGHARRVRLSGATIIDDQPTAGEQGIAINGSALMPFLLAARATTCDPDARPLFAEGLASSYEAFLHTRKKEGSDTDHDDDRPSLPCENGDTLIAPGPETASNADWYLDQLERSLPTDDLTASASHPKVAATARRVLAAWRAGEKVLVFCHFIKTGRTLRQVISGLLHEEIERLAAEKIGCPRNQAEDRLKRFSQMFRRSHGEDSPARREVNAAVEELLGPYSALHPHRDVLLRMCRRFIRTPSFLVRYFSLQHDRIDPDVVRQAFASADGSGLTLNSLLNGFFHFLAHHCADEERRRALEAIIHTQTGAIHGEEARHSFSLDEEPSSTERLLANVRLVNGATKTQTRQRLMLTFNSPFFPEVLIASSVMAEGVDLHRFCRYVIHHDLCWNPSTLEQRTGRVDRIGAKVEQCGHPIRLYLPYLGETQDEKQYRVVMDRERWFGVVMGESFKTDARSTDRLAERVPLPESLARELAFRLEAVHSDANTV